MRRVLTGIQPSGEIHLGNYLGAIRPALELQARYDAFYFIADYHALTTMRDPDLLRRSAREIAATYLALGLDTSRAALFRQSSVPEVCELAWVLSCLIPVGMLDRGHAMKAARDGGLEVNAGTMFYPVLMAADILLYGSHLVPVGQDQKQHVEMARDMAIKMNHHYGDDALVVPEVVVRPDVATVVGLDGRKMSKSYGNTIPLWSRPKVLRKLVMRIVTDSKGVDEPKDPDTCNVFALYKLFASPGEIAEMRERYATPGFGYGHAKQALFEALDATLAAPREQFDHWMAHPRHLDEILAEGARRAGEAASATLARVRERVGLV